jgi:RNA polymerase sigma-70 factor (ECF subfamily)
MKKNKTKYKSIEDKILSLMDNPKSKESGFRLLMQTYQKDLYWHIRNIVGTHEDTDDVLQNTFIKVFRFFDKFKRDASLFTWIYRIATNESLTYLKKRNKQQTEDIGNSYQLTGTESHGLDGEVIIERLNAALINLPEKQKLVFKMRYFEEMTYQQISEILETSVGALKASYHFAVKKIEAELKS